MQDGFYRADFEGRQDYGVGAFALVNGKVGGLDIAGVSYSGTYQRTPEGLIGSIKARAPEGTVLVTGAKAGPGGLTYPVELVVYPNGLVEARTPDGLVKGRLTLVTPL